jgi:hypothetical protein
MGAAANNEASCVSEIVDSPHDFIQEKQTLPDIAIISLISTAGEIALSLIVAQPELREAYLKVFNSSVEQVRKQLKQELDSRNI